MIVVQILFFLLLSPALSSLVMMDKDILYRIFEGWETALIFFSDIDNKECDHAH